MKFNTYPGLYNSEQKPVNVPDHTVHITLDGLPFETFYCHVKTQEKGKIKGVLSIITQPLN